MIRPDAIDDGVGWWNAPDAIIIKADGTSNIHPPEVWWDDTRLSPDGARRFAAVLIAAADWAEDWAEGKTFQTGDPVTVYPASMLLDGKRVTGYVVVPDPVEIEGKP